MQIVTQDPEKHERHKRGHYKAKINHEVREEDEPSVPRPFLDLAGCFSGRDGTGGIFASDTNTYTSNTYQQKPRNPPEI